MPHAPSSAAVALAALALVACASPPQAPAAEQRVLVKPVQPVADGEALARRASEVGGVPARYAASAGAEWHALTLRCADAAECEAALARLRADTRSFAAAELDARRRAQTP